MFKIFADRRIATVVFGAAVVLAAAGVAEAAGPKAVSGVATPHVAVPHVPTPGYGNRMDCTDHPVVAGYRPVGIGLYRN